MAITFQINHQYAHGEINLHPLAAVAGPTEVDVTSPSQLLTPRIYTLLIRLKGKPHMGNTINAGQQTYRAVGEYLQRVRENSEQPKGERSQRNESSPQSLRKPSDTDLLKVLVQLASLPEISKAFRQDEVEQKQESNDSSEMNREKNPLKSIAASVLDWAMDKWPETTTAIKKIGSQALDYIGKGKFGGILKKGLEAVGLGSATSTAKAGASAATSTAAAAGGLAGISTMFQGGEMVAAANKVGGLTGRKVGGIGGLTASVGAGLALNAVGIGLGPIGWAGLLVGGIAAGGLFGSRLGDKDMWKTEGKRIQKLVDGGVEIPDALRHSQMLTRGRSKEELVHKSYPPDFVGMTPEGWVNNKFALSRDENDLKGQDIWGNAAFFEKFGNDWLKTFNEDQRLAIAQLVIEAGLVREHHGTIDVAWTPEIEAVIKESITRTTEAPEDSEKFPTTNNEIGSDELPNSSDA